MTKSGGKDKAQFTYDFGIAISQSTVSKVTRLTGASLTLASAFYALRTTSKEYIETLKEHTLRFGGFLSTMRAMEQAQNRLLKGQSYFAVDDQLKGMNKLMAVGIDVKENLDWINKAAHATGKSFEEFSAMISSAIQGNSQALVDAGLMTQRATRMFDKYTANTVMRQNAILNFVKSHKGLSNAIKNDFETIQDQIKRIKETWTAFLQSIVGKPNDPQSFYGQIVSSMKMVAVAISRNSENLKKAGFVIGQTLGWVIKQIGHFVVWVGRQVKNVLKNVWSITDDFQTQTRSLLVWLEFWKLRIIDFFKEYRNEIKTVLKLLIAYKALKAVFVISSVAINSVKAYRAALLGTVALQKRYMASMGPYVSKTAKFFQSLAVWLPRPFRRAWVAMGKFFADLGLNLKLAGRAIVKGFLFPFKLVGKVITGTFKLLLSLPKLIVSLFKGLRALWTALNATNPIGWVILAITALVTLYNKSKAFRVFVNNFFKATWEAIKLIWNTAMFLFTGTMVAIKKTWGWFKAYIWEPVADFFKSAWGWIEGMWAKFKDSSIGRWLDKWIVTPLKSLFEWIVEAWHWVSNGISKAIGWLSGANNTMSQATKEVADKYGVPTMPTFGGGTYNTTDDTNYLNPKNWSTPSPKEPEPIGTGNPILTPSLNGAQSFGGNGGGPTTNMTFSNGAIQIIVQKGDNINERELALRVKGVINDMKREGDMRGGMV